MTPVEPTGELIRLPQRPRVSRLTPEQRSMQARLAAQSRWAKVEDRTAATAPARAARWREFEDQVDPERRLAPEERARRAASARRAHMTRMALASSRSRTG